MTVEERLRHKLIDRLKEQKELAEADLNGKALVRTRYKMIKDEETGETKRVQVPRLMRRWWWKDDTDAVLLELRYGNKPITIADNKSTIEVGAMDKLPKVIDMVIEAVSAGELDKVLKAAKINTYFRLDVSVRPHPPFVCAADLLQYPRITKRWPSRFPEALMRDGVASAVVKGEAFSQTHPALISADGTLNPVPVASNCCSLYNHTDRLYCEGSAELVGGSDEEPIASKFTCFRSRWMDTKAA
jgi:hypothetical protein